MRRGRWHKRLIYQTINNTDQSAAAKQDEKDRYVILSAQNMACLPHSTAAIFCLFNTGANQIERGSQAEQEAECDSLLAATFGR